MSDGNKVALVTGAGTGIGKASAKALSNAGYALMLAGRRKELLEGVRQEIEGAGGKAIAFACDVGRPDQVRTLFAETKNAFGRLDVLFNNAGMGAPPVPLEDVSYEKWMEVVAVNLTGVFLCTQEAFKIMKLQTPRGGRIINNGSISAHTPRPRSAPYTATKHAITGLTKSTALDGRPYDIACGQIDVGNALTELTARMAQGVAQGDGSIKPEPVMDVEHVAAAVAQMASLPLDTNVLFMTIMATKMPFVGRG